MKKSVRFVTGIALLILMLLLTSIFALADEHEHIYSNTITIITPATCLREGLRGRVCTVNGCTQFTDGITVKKLEHAYDGPATCTTAKTCVNGCGRPDPDGQPLGHRPDPNSATCKTRETCSVCGAVTGGLGSHRFSEATCTTKSTCRICLKTQGELAAHKFSPATCVSPAICTVCDSTSGLPDPSKHSYKAATCTTPKMCRLCNITVGSALGHNWVDNGTTVICSRCGASRLKKPAKQ